jgi:hypothetical protein
MIFFGELINLYGVGNGMINGRPLLIEWIRSLMSNYANMRKLEILNQ